MLIRLVLRLTKHNTEDGVTYQSKNSILPNGCNAALHAGFLCSWRMANPPMVADTFEVMSCLEFAADDVQRLFDILSASLAVGGRRTLLAALLTAVAAVARACILCPT